MHGVEGLEALSHHRDHSDLAPCHSPAWVQRTKKGKWVKAVLGREVREVREEGVRRSGTDTIHWTMILMAPLPYVPHISWTAGTLTSDYT